MILQIYHHHTPLSYKPKVCCQATGPCRHEGFSDACLSWQLSAYTKAKGECAVSSHGTFGQVETDLCPSLWISADFAGFR